MNKASILAALRRMWKNMIDYINEQLSSIYLTINNKTTWSYYDDNTY